MFDRDGNGKVSSSEIGIILRGIGLNPTNQELSTMIKQVDVNGMFVCLSVCTKV